MTAITGRAETFPLTATFRIARGARDEAEVVTVEARRDGVRGWGECVPYDRYGESVESVLDAVAALPPGLDRVSVGAVMPAGAARCAVETALWDLEAKTRGVPAHALLGLPAPGPVLCAYTLSLGEPDAMEAAAAAEANRPLLKVKLGTEDDMARIEAVRRGAPDARLIVDANEGWNAEVYADLAPHLARLGVELVEQPLPAGKDEALRGLDRPVPVCADESCHDRTSLPGLKGLYDVVNIKLNKSGGLAEALALAEAARAEGLGFMVGCMVGTSLAMAPAVIAAQGAIFADLDGPLLLARDRDPPLRYVAGHVHPAEPALWG